MTETKLVAQHLLPLVRVELGNVGGAAVPPTLDEAIARAENIAYAYFAANGLTSIKDICSGQKGGLGKRKQPRATQPASAVDPAAITAAQAVSPVNNAAAASLIDPCNNDSVEDEVS